MPHMLTDSDPDTLGRDNTDQNTDFIRRHIGPDGQSISTMLDTIGIQSLAALIDQTIPADIREKNTPDIGPAYNEHDALATLADMAAQNKTYRSLIGLGYYDTITPPVILRNVLQNPSWYTAYTPYQPEIAQGRLEAMLIFQHMVMDLTGMEVANASLLDEATAAAEAMTLARRMAKNKSSVFLVSDRVHPQTLAVLETRAAPLDIEIITGSHEDLATQDGFGFLVQYPDTTGGIEDFRMLTQAAHDKKALVCVGTDLLALTQLTPPGEWNADIVFGSAQRFGVPLGFGGPHAAFFATREAFKRSVPGRIVGVSSDTHGKPAYRLALQTREQHIRREKATSNICTAQVLLANMAAFYAVWHGAEGLKKIAQRIHRLTCLCAAGLARLGFESEHEHFFDTLVIDAGDEAQHILDRAHDKHMNLRDFGDGRLGLSLDEKSTPAEVFTLWQVFSGQAALDIHTSTLDQETPDALPTDLRRTSDFLTHPFFTRVRSETDMMRYLRSLAQKDIALDRSMIALGSCTMKLNAAAEMIPVSWPAFSDMHPFAPADQTEGYRAMLRDLEDKLCTLTGFDAISLQPNSGAQGEYAGLMVIRAYHESRDEGDRHICLIPSSAHGTNPASAVMAGMKPVIVACDENGNIDVDDLREKAEQHSDTLAALMVTYPSTHGVFEERIQEICDIMHDHGGQVYMDGANFNAMVGLACPGAFGADVMHLNLHKTFSIPHGGGGPGMGPIGAREHLAPFLPGHPLISCGGTDGIGPVSAAPFGSASILAISWMYITMMGSEGLKHATEMAILSANYIAKKLSPHYPVLYTGKNDTVAHECIVDPRALKDSANVSVEDIAKRLMDYGFHAPTVSFPVPGTLMIEPTESESLAELDRFIDALIAIRIDIEKIENGTYPQDNNPLHRAPHTIEDVSTENWERAYTRAHALVNPEDKYWPPVGRIDQAAGDRNFMCSCPPIEDYE